MIKNKGLVVLLAAVVIQVCLGTTYIWSVFQNGIAETIFGGNHVLAGLSFSIQIATMCVGSVVGGRLIAKYSISNVVMWGCVIMSAGFFLASFTTDAFPYFLWLTYGVIGGFGMGFPYATTIACAQEWFPARKGFVSGIIVASLGIGGLIFAPIAEWLITLLDGSVPELKALRIFSFVFLTLGLTASRLLSRPVIKSTEAGTQTLLQKASLSPKQALKTPHLYLLAFTFALSSMGGLMIIGFAKPIAIAKGLVETATIGVLLISIFNSLGRLSWGAISDKYGRFPTMITILCGSALMSLSVIFADGFFLFLAIAAVGFFYGGLLSNFPAITANLFGTKHLAIIYGIILLGFGAGAFASSFIGGYYRNLAAEDIALMNPAFIIASACAVVSILIICIVFKTKDKIIKNRK